MNWTCALAQIGNHQALDPTAFQKFLPNLYSFLMTIASQDRYDQNNEAVSVASFGSVQLYRMEHSDEGMITIQARTAE